MMNHTDDSVNPTDPLSPTAAAGQPAPRQPMAGLTLAQLDAGILTLRSRLAARDASEASSGGRALTAGDVRERARLYLRTIPGAVAGQRGHDRTFYAAGRLVRGFELDPEAAYPLFAEWNQKCDPQWSEHDLRRKLEQAARQPGPRGFLLNSDPPPPGAHKLKDGNAACFRNYRKEEVPDGDTTRPKKVGRGGADLVDELVRYTGGWPRRVGSMLFAVDRSGGIIWMKSANEVFAWIDWQYRLDGGKGYDWAGGPDLMSMETFLAACRQHCEPWEQVERYPHEPQVPGHYYHHPEVPTPASGTEGKALDELVRRFTPATDLDGDLIRLLFLSMLWGGPAGKRPIFVIESASDSAEGGRGAGKTTLASFAASLVGGYLAISPGEQTRDIHARLLSPEGLTLRVGLIDNLKSLRFSSSDLEGLVTSEVISGRQMYTGEGRRPNTLQWVITSNQPALSKDLAQRSVIIRVTTPVYDPTWQKETAAYIAANRWQIVGDCLAELRATGSLAEGHRYTRWAEWEQQVLAKAPEAERLASEIVARQGELDDDNEQASEVRDAIVDLLKRKRFPNPDEAVTRITSEALARTVEQALGMKGAATNKISRAVRHLGIKELDKCNRGGGRGWVWRGKDVAPGVSASFEITDTEKEVGP